MKVLSLFDGMSCSQIALQGLGIEVDTYYASEVDKYAIEVTQTNFPNTIQVGDVTKLDPKDFADVSLIVSGSPCQGFSFAGKQLNFNDPRSALFFEFVRLLKAIKPKYFLLENVRMKKEYQQVISEQVSACYPEIIFGIEPLLINSSLVSAQSRQRLYWTNIPNIKQPEERGIVLRDILETDADTYLSEDAIAYMNRGSEKYTGKKTRAEHYIKHESEKSKTLTANMHKGVPYGVISVDKPKDLVDDTSNLPKKSSVLKSNYYKSSRANFENDKSKGGKFSATGIPQTRQDKPKKVGMHIEKVKVRKHEVDITALQYLLREMKAESKKTNRQIAEETNLPITKVEHWFRTDSSFAIPSDDVWFKLKEILGIKSEVFDKQIMEFEIKDGVYETKQRVYSEDGKSPTLTASNTEQMIETKPKQVGIATDVNGHDILKRVYSPDGKSPTLNTMGGGNREPKIVKGGALRARSKDADGKHTEWKQTKPQQMLELRKDNKSNAVSTVGKDTLVVETPEKSQTIKSQYYKSSRANFERQGTFHATGIQNEDLTWRKLTVRECRRLQTIPEDYQMPVSNTQAYKMLGNGFTCEVIKHIFNNMEL